MVFRNLINAIRQRRKKREEQREFPKMLYSIQRMYGGMMRQHYLMDHLRRATEEEVANLISENAANEVEKKHMGYYIPPLDKFIKHSLEIRPDWVFHLDRLDIFGMEDGPEREPFSQWDRILPKELLSKDFYVFLYDSFGLPETHLCARRGYVLYDPELREMVAYVWNAIS